MKILPHSDIVVIRRLPPDDRTASGIFLAWDEDYKEDIGIVVHVGPGKRYGCKRCKTDHVRPVDVKVGDKVIFSTNGHQITKKNGEELIVLREPSIIGVIEDAGSQSRNA